MSYEFSRFRNLSRLFCSAVLGMFSVAVFLLSVFSVSAAETKPLTLKATAQSTKPAQAAKSPTPVTKKAEPASAGAFGVKQIDPFHKDADKKVEKQPNVFQELLDRKVELPKKKRTAAKPVKKTTNVDNPFADAEVENPFDGGDVPENPFEDGDFPENPFDGGDKGFGDEDSFVPSVNPSNPFAAGDPFADEDPRNQVSSNKPKGPTNRAKPQGAASTSEESLKNPFED